MQKVYTFHPSLRTCSLLSCAKKLRTSTFTPTGQQAKLAKLDGVLEGTLQAVVQVLIASFQSRSTRPPVFLLLASSVDPRQVTVGSMGVLDYIPSLANDMRD